jgi:hypothetical protein
MSPRYPKEGRISQVTGNWLTYSVINPKLIEWRFYGDAGST